MKMVTDQNHSSDAEVYSALSGENRVLKKQLEDYHFQYTTLERRVKRLERDVGSLKIELEDLDECVDRETVLDLIHEIIPSLIGKKGKASCCSSYLSDSFEESDLVEIIEGPYRVQVREKKDVPHKQRRKARPIKVKRVVV